MIWGCSHPLFSETSILTNTQKVPATDVRKHVHSKCPIRAVPWHHGYSARFWGWNGHGQILKQKICTGNKSFLWVRGRGCGDEHLSIQDKFSTQMNFWWFLDLKLQKSKCWRFPFANIQNWGPRHGSRLRGPSVRISTTIPCQRLGTHPQRYHPQRCTCFMRRSKEDTSRSTALKFPGQRPNREINCETFNPITFGASNIVFPAIGC